MPKNKATNKDKDFDTDRYCTPAKALRPVYTLWPGGIGLDPCGDTDAVLAAGTVLDIRTKLPDQDGRYADWCRLCDANVPRQRTCFVNPPYSSPGEWAWACVQFTTSNSRCESILLLPTSFETEWWEDAVWAHAAAICFVRKRFQFLKRGLPDRGPRGNSIYVLHASADVRAEAIRRFVAAFGSVGQVVTNRDGWGT